MDQDNLTCLDIRRALGENPEIQNSAIRTHIQKCQSCQHYSQQALEQNTLLKKALEVPIPEGLSDRILLDRHIKTNQPWKKWMLAASLIACVMIYSALHREQTDYNWALISAQHIAAESNTLLSEKSISEDDFKVALSEWGLSLKNTLGKISYLDYCAMPNGKGLHVVFNLGDSKKVSLILPPPGSKPQINDARYGDYYASSLSIGNQGLSVVTENPQQLYAATHLIVQNVTPLIQ